MLSIYAANFDTASQHRILEKLCNHQDQREAVTMIPVAMLHERVLLLNCRMEVFLNACSS